VSIDGFVCHDGRIFAAALDGDATALWRATGPDGVYCLDPQRHAALLVFTGPGGFQQGNVYLSGQVLRLEIPRSFRVRDIHLADGLFAVTVADGQVIRGTARQFGCQPRLIDEADNPAYQDQLAGLFRDTGRLPDPDAYPDACPAIQDPLLGALVHPGGYGHYAAMVERDGVALAVSFDSAGADRVTELLPHARRLVTGIAGLHDRARDLIWATGADGAEPPEARERFHSVLRPTDLTVFRTGDFEVCFEDDGTYLEDGYWIAVYHRADTTPVHAHIDC
jgi:hypothetical protein